MIVVILSAKRTRRNHSRAAIANARAPAARRGCLSLPAFAGQPYGFASWGRFPICLDIGRLETCPTFAEYFSQQMLVMGTSRQWRPPFLKFHS